VAHGRLSNSERHVLLAKEAPSLLESIPGMADWKQITARIRRARTSKDPAGQLTNLFSKTRDAMVAFELARYFETSGNHADAGRWYLTAAERFRRTDWKTKAQESATRLGATEPAEIPEPAPAKVAEAAPTPAEATPAALAEPEIGNSIHEAPAERHTPQQASDGRGTQRQKRGRRGGRESRGARREQRESKRGTSEVAATAPEPARAAETVPEVVPASVPSLRGKFGDPGLTSRLMQLEMNFRRLLGSTPTSLDAADKAPAGPGVWVLTDSDLTTYYYVEPCQTLRVAIPNLLRGGTSRKGESIRPKLAEHLGIPEAKVGKYLSDHCVVRWLQMDVDAAYFAHFLIAVLRPALNE
jgi:hypothetical protein